ncbi:MAG: DUF4124 domain-containing protein [Gallionella sp.]|nr:DUF4124 domain-containing protein [Gallionella sp.]
MNRVKLLALCIMGCCLSFPAAAKLYKWVDAQGMTHYGEVIPPEFANNNRSELTPNGREINKREKLTPEQEKAKAEELRRQSAEEEAKLEQKRRDKALLNTFSSVREIDESKMRNLQQIESMINSTNTQLKLTQEKLQDLKAESAARVAAGKNIYPYLRNQMHETQLLLTKQQNDVAKFKAEKASIEARFEADKARYRILTNTQ